MKGLVSAVAGLAVFGFWMSIVGNPHVVETVIGLVISSYVAYKVHTLEFWRKDS